MSIIVRCQTCGHLLKAPADSTGRRGECPFCGKTINISSPSSTGAAAVGMGSDTPDNPTTAPFESMDIEHFLDPPSSEHPAASAAVAAPKNQVWRRMFEALLDREAFNGCLSSVARFAYWA